MGIFSRKKDGKSKKKGASQDQYDQQPAKPEWTDGWARTSVEPEEVHELVKRCTEEIKKRGMFHLAPPPPSRHFYNLVYVFSHLGLTGICIWDCHCLRVRHEKLINGLNHSSRSSILAPAFSADFRSQRCSYLYTPFLRRQCTPRRAPGTGAADDRADGNCWCH